MPALILFTIPGLFFVGLFATVGLGSPRLLHPSAGPITASRLNKLQIFILEFKRAIIHSKLEYFYENRFSRITTATDLYRGSGIVSPR